MTRIDDSTMPRNATSAATSRMLSVPNGTGELPARYRGITAFMVRKPRGEEPQGVAGRPIPKIGHFGWNTRELALNGCRVPAQNRAGEEAGGFYLATPGLQTHCRS